MTDLYMTNMESTEPYAHSFIVRVWLEEEVQETGQTKWRGHITHVPSGKRKYISELDIDRFIIPYMRRLGVNLDA